MDKLCSALLALVVAYGGLVTTGAAQWSAGSRPGPLACTCDQCLQHAAQKDGPAEQKKEGPERSQPQLPEVPAGMFVAPPRAGEVIGPQRSFGIPALKLTLPELTISTPRLEISGFHSSRREPHVRLDGGVAPYAADPNYTRSLMLRQAELDELNRQQQLRGDDAGPTQRSDKEALTPPLPPPPCPTDKADARRIQALESQIAVLMQQIEQLKQATEGRPAVFVDSVPIPQPGTSRWP